jgi:hypothetical protein
VLVEQEFDRFVGVKAATADIFAEMKEGPLADGADYGIKQLKDALGGEFAFRPNDGARRDAQRQERKRIRSIPQSWMLP